PVAGTAGNEWVRPAAAAAEERTATWVPAGKRPRAPSSTANTAAVSGARARTAAPSGTGTPAWPRRAQWYAFAPAAVRSAAVSWSRGRTNGAGADMTAVLF